MDFVTVMPVYTLYEFENKGINETGTGLAFKVTTNYCVINLSELEDPADIKSATKSCRVIFDYDPTNYYTYVTARVIPVDGSEHPVGLMTFANIISIMKRLYDLSIGYVSRVLSFQQSEYVIFELYSCNVNYAAVMFWDEIATNGFSKVSCKRGGCMDDSNMVVEFTPCYTNTFGVFEESDDTAIISIPVQPYTTYTAYVQVLNDQRHYIEQLEARVYHLENPHAFKSKVERVLDEMDAMTTHINNNYEDHDDEEHAFHYDQEVAVKKVAKKAAKKVAKKAAKKLSDLGTRMNAGLNAQYERLRNIEVQLAALSERRNEVVLPHMINNPPVSVSVDPPPPSQERDRDAFYDTFTHQSNDILYSDPFAFAENESIDDTDVVRGSNMYDDSYAKDANMKVKYAIQTRQNVVHMTNDLLDEQERDELDEQDNQIYNWMDECNYYKKQSDYECYQGGCDNECGCDCCSDFDDEYEVFYE